MQSDNVAEAFESHVDGEGWDLMRLPSGAYHSKRTADALVIWRAARKAALEEVRAELKRRYDEADRTYKGSYGDGHATAFDVMEGWVEQLMEQDA